MPSAAKLHAHQLTLRGDVMCIPVVIFGERGIDCGLPLLRRYTRLPGNEHHHRANRTRATAFRQGGVSYSEWGIFSQTCRT
ncbi:hypothetical protein JZ751_026656 [Albula glossodonta]|uniref:Uncharacterized protein n=1 Tax=Albula glossodonta TaxID=121402 RepID=A0A8T2PKS0_9TELE|nr:hypothetical protein JZ751_026656 [Albula glossodonta]